MKAVLVTKTTREIVDRSVPEPEADEVLIKVEVAASNPKDWKYPLFFDADGIEGSDAAGFVEAVGSGVSEFKKGDRVAAFTKMDGGDRTGTYAEYTIAKANTTFKLGSKTSFEDAAGVPLAYLTAAIGLYRNLGLKIPAQADQEGYAAPGDGDKPASVLVYGAASTVGIFVTQLAKKLGLFVVGVAGASQAAAKAYGADVVLDYRSPSFEQDLFAAVKEHGVHHVYDTVAEGGTFELAARAVDAIGGDNFVTTVLPPQSADSLPKSVKIVQTYVGDAHNPAKEGAQEFARKFSQLAGVWLESGELKPQKVTVVPGGLAGVAEGLKRYQENKVSGEKLVYRISETPGLA